MNHRLLPHETVVCKIYPYQNARAENGINVSRVISLSKITLTLNRMTIDVEELSKQKHRRTKNAKSRG